MNIDDRKKLAALRSKAHALNNGLEDNNQNTDKYVVVGEKLCVFRGCSRQGERLIGGTREDVAHEFVADGSKLQVHLN